MVGSPCNTPVALGWACTQPFYRSLAEAFVTNWRALGPGLFADAVDGLFLLTFGAAAAPYLNAWKANYAITEITVTVEDAEVRLYVALSGWVSELAAAFDDPDSCLSELVCTQRTPYVG